MVAKIALLVGVSDYERAQDLNPLPSAARDVEAMQRVLEDPEIGEFSDVMPLINPDPLQMQMAIETLFRNRQKDDLVLLYFSGHGITDDRGHLHFATRVTKKTPQGELVKATAVPAKFIHDAIADSRSKRQVIILDCCFSGAFDPALYAKDDGSVNLQSELGAEGRVVLTSSSSTQYSFEQTGSELSVYTRYLVEGLATGSADLGNDGKISMHELHDYARNKVHETAPSMNPKIITLKDEGFDIVLARAKVTDPKSRYFREATRYASRGEISNVGRAILNRLRAQVGLALDEAAAIEEQVLQPYHQRLENLASYRETLKAAIAREYPLSDDCLTELQAYQDMLGLRSQDVAAIEQEVLAELNQGYSPELSLSYQPKSATEPSVPSPAAVPLPLVGDGGTVEPVQPMITPSSSSRWPKWLVGGAVGLVLLLAGGGGIVWMTVFNRSAESQLEEARLFQRAGNYQACIHHAQAVPSNHALYAEAARILSECQAEEQAQTWLTTAQAKASNGEWAAGLQILRQVPATSRLSDEVKSLTQQWSEKLLQQATDLYDHQSKITEAIALTKDIPETSPLAAEVQKRVAQWTNDWQRNDPHLAAARKAMNENDWWTAKETAQQIQPTTPFWKKEAADIINSAQAQIDIYEAQQAAAAAEEARQAAAERAREAEQEAERAAAEQRKKQEQSTPSIPTPSPTSSLSIGGASTKP